MTPNELKNKILLNQIPHLMIFTGPETYVRNYYISKITSNKYIKMQSYNELLSNSKVKSLFNDIENYIIEDSNIENNESDWKSIISNFTTNNNIYIFIVDNIKKDFETMFYNFITYFNKLNETLLYKYFSNTDISYNNLNLLFNICNYDYTYIHIEIDKVKNYAISNNLTNDISFQLLLKQNIIIQPIGDIIFNFTNSILKGDLSLTNYWLNKIKQTGEPLLGILKVLYKGFNDLLMIKCSDNDKTLQNNLGYALNQIWGIRYNINVYNIKEIIRNMRILEYIDISIKNGEMEEDYALDYMTVNLLA